MRFLIDKVRVIVMLLTLIEWTNSVIEKCFLYIFIAFYYVLVVLQLFSNVVDIAAVCINLTVRLFDRL